MFKCVHWNVLCKRVLDSSHPAIAEGTVDGIFGNLRFAAGCFAEEHDPLMHMMEADKKL